MGRGNDELAELWVESLKASDFKALGKLMADGVKIWHSFDGMWLTKEEGDARMADAPQPGGDAAASLFGDVRAQATATGVLVQATMGAGGLGPQPVHIVQVLTADDGLITVVEEYIAAQSA
jgi:hypothetical protein